MTDKSCWTCGWRQSGGFTLLGFCWWFAEKHHIKKEIPPNVCDKGCKFWTNESKNFDMLQFKIKDIDEKLQT